MDKNYIVLTGKMLLLTFGFGLINTSLSAQAPHYASPSEAKLLHLQADAPKGTQSVRFFINKMQVAELTDQYARKTETEPVWETVIDPEWISAGTYQLRIEMTGADGRQTTVTRSLQGAGISSPDRLSLTGEWLFAEAADLPAGALEGETPAAAAAGYRKGKWTPVMVPNSIGAVADRWNQYEGIIGAYRKTVNWTAGADEQSFIFLESVYWSGRVFINGKPAGETRGGYLPVRLPVSRFLKKGKNDIVIIADNRFSTMGVFKRLNEFYWNWGGLVQEVYLEKYPAAALTDLRAEGNTKGELHLHALGLNAAGTAASQQITVEVWDASGNSVLKKEGLNISLQPGNHIIALPVLSLPSPHVWSIDDPYLYRVRVQGAFGSIITRLGFRDVEVKGMDILLNGQPLQGLQGFNRHADYPGLGRTQPAALVYNELKMLRDKGFRFFRPAHYPTTPALLDAADELGLIAIEEVNVTGLRGEVMASEEVISFGKQQLLTMIHRDRGHPSVIAWSVGNENLTEEEGAADYVKEVIAAGRAVDANRLYTQVTHRHTNDKTFAYQDFVAQNYYAGWYAKDVNAIVTLFDAIQSYAGNKPVMLSEYGAEAVIERKGFQKSSEFYQGFVADAHNRLLNNRPHFTGKMYWCSTEFWCRPNWHGGSPEPIQPFHAKSLIGLDRRHKKLAWRVIFSPVRIVLNPHTVRANDLGGVVLATPGKDTTITQVITIRDLKGVVSNGTIRVQAPEGFSCDKPEQPFQVNPGEGQSFTIVLHGRLAPGAASADVVISAIIDEETEAQPQLISIEPRPTAIP